MKVISFGATDPGKKRDHNEDAYLAQDALGLYAVADGVGGSEGGEIASRVALETLAQALPDLINGKDATRPRGLSRGGQQQAAPLEYAFVLTNQMVRREQERDSALALMCTTLTALLLKNGSAFLAHVGDSRAYLLRSGELKQLTHDHSFVAEQVRAGALTIEQARRSPHRHVITRAIGIDAEVAADIMERKVEPNDTFLLCTDGLTEMVDDREIEKILAGHAPREAAKKLVNAANDGGGVDNITAVVVRIVEP